MVWRAEALENRQWDYAAWIAFNAARCMAKDAGLPEDFHPRRIAEKAANDEAAAAQLEETRKLLPNSMTEEEIEAEWNAMQYSWRKG